MSDLTPGAIDLIRLFHVSKGGTGGRGGPGKDKSAIEHLSSSKSFAGDKAFTPNIGQRKRIINRGAKIPLVPAVFEWARLKGINPYILARSIQKKGTKKHPFMFKSMEEEAPDFIKGMERLFAEVILPAAASRPNIPNAEEATAETGVPA